MIFGSFGSFGVFWGRIKTLKRKLLLPHIPFAIALNTIGRETGDGIPGASTAKTTSLGITCQPTPLPFDPAAPSDRGYTLGGAREFKRFY